MSGLRLIILLEKTVFRGKKNIIPQKRIIKRKQDLLYRYQKFELLESQKCKNSMIARFWASCLSKYYIRVLFFNSSVCSLASILEDFLILLK